MTIIQLQITVVPHDPRWPDLYAAEKSRILSALSSLQPAIEHVGSTAVPGLDAKPVIDIMAGVRAALTPDDIESLRAIGYGYLRSRRGSLCLYRGKPRVYFLHIVRKDGPEWEADLLFRDYLRSHPEAAAAYAALKHGLADGGASSGEYSRGKGKFILEILSRARRRKGWH
jgi:GrpB-like predicted nucleotidyltransferase (UPF0157 family)